MVLPVGFVELCRTSPFRAKKAPQLIELQGFNSRGMAERTGLEPATSNVTGWRSNQLSYRSIPVRVARKLGDDPCRCNTYFCEK